MEEFSKELASHPDQQQVSYVLKGVQHGFWLGFHSAHKLKPAKRNKPSALHHAHIVDAYLANKVSLGRVASPSPLFLVCIYAVLGSFLRRASLANGT